MKIGFITLGCKVNIYESNALKDELIKRGYIVSEAEEDCDCFVINTCSVTNQADSKSRKMISKCHRLNPDALLCVMGCYSQTNQEEASKLFPKKVMVTVRWSVARLIHHSFLNPGKNHCI